MLTQKEAQKSADVLSKIISEKMSEYIKPIKEQKNWFENEIRIGVLSKLSDRLTDSDKKLLKNETEKIITKYKDAIGAMKAIQFMCDEHNK